MLNSLADSVEARYLHGVKPISETVYRLMVAAVDGEVPAEKRGEYRAIDRVYVMHGIALSSVVICGVDVLNECAAEEYVDQLMTAADAHYRLLCLNEMTQKLHLGGISRLVNIDRAVYTGITCQLELCRCAMTLFA